MSSKNWLDFGKKIQRESRTREAWPYPSATPASGSRPTPRLPAWCAAPGGGQRDL